MDSKSSNSAPEDAPTTVAPAASPLPPAAKRLVRLSELRVACAAAGIGCVDVVGPRAVFCKAGSRAVVSVRRLEGGTPDAKIRELARALAGP